MIIMFDIPAVEWAIFAGILGLYAFIVPLSGKVGSVETAVNSLKEWKDDAETRLRTLEKTEAE